MNALANYQASLTDEQRAEMLAKAALARAAAKAQREANKLTLKMDYLDSNHWADLASKYKIRMPMQGVAASKPVIRKYLKLCGIERQTWDDHYTSAEFFITNNVGWTAYAVAGLILEMKEEGLA
jgi:hypothetical protein